MKIAFYSAKPYDRLFFESLPHDFDIQFLESHLTPATVKLAEGADAVCCFVNDTLSAEVLSALSALNIKMVALRCAGFNNVDLATAKELGIHIARVPEYSPYAVAEHTMGLILALNRHIHRAYNRTRENDYSLHGLMGFDLHGKNVGVIGCGKIGQALIAILKGFGCNVFAYDPKLTIEGVTQVALDEIWPQCDIVSLHCPLTPQTHHLINDHTIAQLPKGAMLINTSRGGLVDTQAVIKHLKNGQLGYVGIDVYEEEADLFFEDLSDAIVQDDTFARLMTFPNVLVTGHQAFFTREALKKIAEVTLSNLTAYKEQRLNDIQSVS